MAFKERSVIKTYHLNDKTIVMLPIRVHYWANIGQCLSGVKISKNCQGSIDVIFIKGPTIFSRPKFPYYFNIPPSVNLRIRYYFCGSLAKGPALF